MFAGEGEVTIIGSQDLYLIMTEYAFNYTNPNISVYQNYLVRVTLDNKGEVEHSFMVLGVSEDSGYISSGESMYSAWA